MRRVLQVQESQQNLLALWPIEECGLKQLSGLTMIFASKTLLEPFSTHCICSSYSRQYCITGYDTGEFTTFVTQDHLRDLKVSPRRIEALSSLTKVASDRSNSRCHWPIRPFGYLYLTGASSS